jgi:hypothetical protein
MLMEFFSSNVFGVVPLVAFVNKVFPVFHLDLKALELGKCREVLHNLV